MSQALRVSDLVARSTSERVVGVLAAGAVVFYAALSDGPPTPEAVVLAISIPSKSQFTHRGRP